MTLLSKVCLLLGVLTLTVSGTKWSPPCTITVNGGARNCCPTTGLCQDSSCTVLGFKNSVKANCPNGPNCPAGSEYLNYYCNYTQPSCPYTDPNHCYGKLVCKSGVTCSKPVLDLFCLNDGTVSSNPDGFKVCGTIACNNKAPFCPSGYTCQGNSVNPNSGQSTGGECVDFYQTQEACTQCQDRYTNAVCQNVESQKPGYKALDIPGASGEALMSMLQDYNCNIAPGCNTIVCEKELPDGVLTNTYTACSERMV